MTQDSATISGNTISGKLVFTNSNANELSGVTVSSTGVVSGNGREFVTQGLTLNGEIDIVGGGWLSFGAANETEAVTGNGKIVFDSNTGNRIILGGNVTLTIGSGITIGGQNGKIGPFSLPSSPVTINNDGTIQDNVSGGTITLEDCAITNDPSGVLQAQSGGNFSLDSSSFTNNGTASVAGGSTVNSNSPFTNAGGSVTVDGQLAMTGNGGIYTQTGGTTTIDSGGTLSQADINPISIQAGTLQGNGTVSGNVTNSGTVSPGLSPGLLTVTGNYTQNGGGRSTSRSAAGRPAPASMS